MVARRLAFGFLVASCAALFVPALTSAFSATKDRETHLLSRSFSGGFPNGPSRDGAFSQDAQAASLAAFDSDASDIVRGDTNGLTDVFVVRRGGHFTEK